MKIRYLSDLHLEHQTIHLSATEDDSQTVLVVAGDIAGLEHSRSWLESLSARFLAVVAVLGNHDYWLGSLEQVESTQPGLHLGIRKNVHILHRNNIRIEDPERPGSYTNFIGATLWCNPPPTAQAALQFAVKDYKLIRKNNNTELILPADIVARYQDDVRYLASELSKKTTDYTVVVTHYPPSYQSLDPRYADHPNSALLNTNYFNDLDYWIDDKYFDSWIHGHIHCSHTYPFGSGYIYCNPRGYGPDRLNPEFNEFATIDSNPDMQLTSQQSMNML